MAGFQRSGMMKVDQDGETEALRLSEVVMIKVLKDLYLQKQEEEKAVQAEWAEQKPLLEQKKWTIVEQLKILEKQVSELHGSLAEMDKRIVERRQVIKSVYVKALTAFYQRHNPEKLSSIGALMDHFKGREYEILAKIEERYHENVDFTIFENAGVAMNPEDDFLLLGLKKKKEKFWEEIAQLEDLAERSTEELEKIKRETYFPHVNGWQYKQGVDGIYVGMKNFWIEHISATMSISVLDRVDEPRMLVVLSDSIVKKFKSRVDFSGDPVGGNPPSPKLKPSSSSSNNNGSTSSNPSKGAVISFQLDKCGIYGEKGTKIPTMKPEQLKLLVEFRFTLPVEFNRSKGIWRAAKGFQFKIMRIERKITGSIYVPKSLLQMVLNRFLPGLVKKAILKSIPIELGHYFSHRYESPEPTLRPKAMHLDLDIGISGIPGDLGALEVDIGLANNAAAESIRSVIGLTLEEAKTFVAVQNEIHGLFQTLKVPPAVAKIWPGPLNTVAALVRFFMRLSHVSYSTYAVGKKNVKKKEASISIWDGIVSTWQQVIDRYCGVFRSKNVNMKALFEKIHQLTLKPVKQSIEVRNLRFRTSIDGLLAMTRSFLVRSTKEMHQESAKKRVHLKKPLEKHLEEIEEWYKQTLLPISYIKTCMNSIGANVHGEGNAGEFSFSGRDVGFVGPVRLEIPFQKSLYPPTHFAIDTSIREHSGSFDLDLLLAPFVLPQTKMNGPVVRFSLSEVTSGVFFDVKNYLCSKILDFKNQQLNKSKRNLNLVASPPSLPEQLWAQQHQAVVPQLSLNPDSPAIRRLLFKTRSKSDPTFAATLRRSRSLRDDEDEEDDDDDKEDNDENNHDDDDQDEMINNGDEQKDEAATNEQQQEVSVDTEDCNTTINSQNMAKILLESRRPSTSDSVGTMTSSSTVGNDDGDDGGGDETQKHQQEKDVAMGEGDEDMLEAMRMEKEMDILVEHELEVSQDFEDMDLLGPVQKYERENAEDDTSLDQFARFFFRELAKEEGEDDDGGMSILSASFAQDEDDEHRFMFNVDTHKYSLMRASARKFELHGSVQNVYQYICGWIEHVLAQAQQTQDDVVETEYRVLRIFAETLMKYFDREEMRFHFTFLFDLAVKREQLVASIAQPGKIQPPGRVPFNSSETAVFETSFNLLEFIADMLSIFHGKQPGTVDPIEMLCHQN